ncbi:type II secretion system protein [Bacillus sp. BRMEA1]|uniref:type II secretion system protein n=1 Tax=Neobacillus endophyticus TaxID=2738405 RepID=UPI001564ED71|nr:type II secretion system protein [Neobacillus endophyticus]NRD76001.1 type II secretion system protein [Neobacillus endophyticus]
MMKKKLKDQKGMTLIELLAVIVILGIISAIAIPSILGLIDNSKKDAHVANARQMINSAKLAVTGDSTLQPANGATVYVTLKYLEDKGYVETVKDPDGTNSGYAVGDGTAGSSKPSSGSYVQISADSSGKLSYSVFLTNGTRSVKNTDGTPVSEDKLSRDSVN